MSDARIPALESHIYDTAKVACAILQHAAEAALANPDDEKQTFIAAAVAAATAEVCAFQQQLDATLAMVIKATSTTPPPSKGE